MKTKLLLSTLTLGLLAGAGYLWQARAQAPQAPPEGGPAVRKHVPPRAQQYEYKVVMQRLPVFNRTASVVDSAPVMQAEAEILKSYADWEIVSVEPLRLEVPARNHKTNVIEEPVMVYTLRKPR